jgi:hypothetical protein
MLLFIEGTIANLELLVICGAPKSFLVFRSTGWQGTSRSTCKTNIFIIMLNIKSTKQCMLINQFGDLWTSGLSLAQSFCKDVDLDYNINACCSSLEQLLQTWSYLLFEVLPIIFSPWIYWLTMWGTCRSTHRTNTFIVVLNIKSTKQYMLINNLEIFEQVVCHWHKLFVRINTLIITLIHVAIHF